MIDPGGRPRRWAAAVTVLGLGLLGACAGRGYTPEPVAIPTEPTAKRFAPTPGAPFDPPVSDTPPPPAGPIGLGEVEPDGLPDTVATLDGVPITKREVADFLFVDQPAQARRLTEDLILSRIVRLEVERHGVFVPEPTIAARVTADRAMREKAAKKAGISLRDYTLREFGLSVTSYDRLAPILIRSQMLRARLVRYAQVLEDRAEARIIVVPDRAQADRVVKQLADGADFATIARQVSVHSTHRSGGLLPPVARWGIEPDLEAKLFELEVGAASAPIRVERVEDGSGTESWAVLKCLRFRAARNVSYAEVREELERELEARPLQMSPEWAGWIAKMQRRYRIERFYEPLPGARTVADTEIGAPRSGIR